MKVYKAAACVEVLVMSQAVKCAQSALVIALSVGSFQVTLQPQPHRHRRTLPSLTLMAHYLGTKQTAPAGGFAIVVVAAYFSNLMTIQKEHQYSLGRLMEKRV